MNIREYIPASWTQSIGTWSQSLQTSAARRGLAPQRMLAGAGVLFVLASFGFVVFTFLALQVQTWLVG